MSDEDASFVDLVRRVRARDEQAAAELVRRYEPSIRLAVRVRLTDPALRRLLDSVDICQSVLANFFVRAASGQFELERPQQLVNLLVTMARNKLTNYALHHHAARRDQRRQQAVELEEQQPAAPGPSVSQVLANRELLEAFRSQLTEEERRVADLRGQGHAWPEIAAAVGGNPDVLRIHFTRALDRVAQLLRLEE
jgi:RNA polymerase sigma-70 factor (ECF subfamily)